MPIYEYLCMNCQKRFEVLVNLNNQAKVICPDCQSDRVKRLVSAFGIGGGGSRIKSGGNSCSTCSSHSCSTCK
ncbi:MAG: zinc ribbon domain-containing protein [Candidatus Aminicenantes bacterium]|nr:zinc ribbon domain-containing protein [Candidatus Aminicenantes bacterium]